MRLTNLDLSSRSVAERSAFLCRTQRLRNYRFIGAYAERQITLRVEWYSTAGLSTAAAPPVEMTKLWYMRTKSRSLRYAAR